MIRIFQFDIQVKAGDIDFMGHINNVSYVHWMQLAAVAHSAASGWDFDSYQKLGSVWVAREHQIEYLRAGFETDTLAIRTWVSGMKRVSSTRHYEFVRKLPLQDSEYEVIAIAETKWAFVDLQSMTPKKIPSAVSDCFEIVKNA